MEIITEYAEQIFYFCLKRCGNGADAEDLTQDIVLNVMVALAKATPANVSAYIWRIARNRYAGWAEQKRRRNESESGAGFEGLSAEGTPEDEFIRAEHLRVLRRELAFIAEDYRKIVVAHYIDDRSVGDIAQSLSMPRGTVLWRLHRARQKIKEGMNMSRTFGTKSYKPEQIAFSATGTQKHGLPWSAVNRLIPKNILLAADGNPSTIEDLAIEMGIAAPYMEEEVRILEDARLLRKDGDKYVTNFFIADKQCQDDVKASNLLKKKRRAELVEKIAADAVPHLRTENIAPASLSEDELKWTAALRVIDFIHENTQGRTIDFPVKHKHDDDSWGFFGFEAVNKNSRMSHNGMGRMGVQIWEYVLSKYMKTKTKRPDSWKEVVFLRDVLREKRCVSAMSDMERMMLQTMVNSGIISVEGDEVLLNIPIFTTETMGAFKRFVFDHPLHAEIQALYQETFDDAKSILRRYSNPVLAEQMDYCATMLTFGLRDMAVEGIFEAGGLVIPADTTSSLAGVYMEVTTDHQSSK
jgi:RNA polymerase sigma factor (sigma-70 family)